MTTKRVTLIVRLPNNNATAYDSRESFAAEDPLRS